MKFKKFFSAVAAGLFFAVTFASNTVSVNAEFKTPSQEVINSNFEGDESFQKFLESIPQKNGSYKSSQRPIMIEGAMNIEIEKFVKLLEKPVVYKHLNYLYFAGTYKNYPVIVARTEQGVANAAAVTALGIKNFNPVFVINQGTAGGYVPTLHKGNVVICEKAVNTAAYKEEYSPQGSGIDITKQEMRGTFAYDKDSKTFQLNKEYSADEKLLKIAKKVADTHKEFTVVTGNVSSADTWRSGIDHIKFLNEKYGAVCEEMETASAAQICQSSNIPFIGIRTLSNNITNGEEHDPNTSKYSQSFVLLMLDEYIKDISKK